MTLYEQIREDLKQAMRDKDSQTLDVLRLLTSSMKNKAIDLKKELEEADVLAAIKSDVKKLQDALKDFKAAAREDLVEKTEAEIAILKKYLPEEMSMEAVTAKVKEVLAREGITEMSDIGRAMGAAMKELQGQVDGNKVREAVQKELSQN